MQAILVAFWKRESFSGGQDVNVTIKINTPVISYLKLCSIICSNVMQQQSLICSVILNYLFFSEGTDQIGAFWSLLSAAEDEASELKRTCVRAPTEKDRWERGMAGVPGIISKSNSGRMSSSTPVLPGEGRRSDINSSSGQQMKVQSLGSWLNA